MRSFHLVHGDSAAGSLRQAAAGGGSGAVLVLRPTLSTGPCPLSPTVAEAGRRLHWPTPTWTGPTVRALARSVEKDILGSGSLIRCLRGLPKGRPIVIWSSPAWSDQLQLLWVLDAIQGSDLDPARF